MDDTELARRSVANFGEILAVVGAAAGDRGSAVRRADAIGARIPGLAGNPWLDAVVVPAGMEPPEFDSDLPTCVWALRGPVVGRIEDAAVAMPCMGLILRDRALPFAVKAIDVGRPGLEEVGTMNDRAYGSGPALGPLAGRIDDDRVATHGLAVDGRFVCAAMTLTVGDDLGIHFVSTESGWRRRGLAATLLASVIARAQSEGVRTATLQASPDGLPVYRQMGFTEVGRLHAWVRPTP